MRRVSLVLPHLGPTLFGGLAPKSVVWVFPYCVWKVGPDPPTSRGVMGRWTSSVFVGVVERVKLAGVKATLVAASEVRMVTTVAFENSILTERKVLFLWFWLLVARSGGDWLCLM